MSKIGEDHALDALLDTFDPTDLVISDEDLDLALLDNSFEWQDNNLDDLTLYLLSPPQMKEEILAAQAVVKVQAMNGQAASNMALPPPNTNNAGTVGDHHIEPPAPKHQCVNPTSAMENTPATGFLDVVNT